MLFNLHTFMLSATTTPNPEFSVNITQNGNPSIGRNYTLICSIFPNLNMTVRAFEWFYQDELTNAINTSSHVKVINQLFESELSFFPLHESHTGEYTCQASLGNGTRESSYFVNTTGMFLDLLISKLILESYIYSTKY